MRSKKRLVITLTLLICLSACVGFIPANAEEDKNAADTGLCIHHSEHSEECGYAEAAPMAGSSCSYAVNGCPGCVVSWDLAAVPESGVGEGEYILTADPTDPDCTPAENVPPLNVSLQLDSAETDSTALSSGEPPYSEHILNGVSPNGTVIDLFDYWITNQTEADNTNPGWLINKGINADHALIFQADAEKSKGYWNVWTSSKSPTSGVVQNELADGYPRLNIDTSTATDVNIRQRDGKESLAYLFDPNIRHNGKASYGDVKGLLQVDSEGYYYYDSKENYAVYSVDTNSFSLYRHPGVLPGGRSPVGQFFPFNTATSNAETIQYGNRSYTLMNKSVSTDPSINHYFGMHMSTRFVQQNGGYTDGSRAIPVTYEFSGDDDVWIFIDGILAADLGGIHDAASVSVNFATGEVYINDTNSNGHQDAGEDGYAYYKLGTKLGLPGDTLADNTYHRLDFFYLERGNTDSNLYLKYNLVAIPESDLIKVDQLGNPVEGAEFTLYGAADYEAGNDSAEPIATGTTDSRGEFVFLEMNDAGSGFPITIDKLYNLYHSQKDSRGNNLILVETKTPAGYRSVGEIGLYFYQSGLNPDEILLMSNSIWDKGAYAMPKVTTTTSNSVLLLKNANDITGTEREKVVNLAGDDAVENPVMFAVVFQKQTSADGSYAWLPVSGDPLNGWTVRKDSTWDNVLAAAQHSPYIFRIASSGAYQVEIKNLPGDIQTYYHICKDLNEAQYTIAYYYTEAEALANASESNTWRIESATKEDKYKLSRIFSVDLYVTNVKNDLLVQKVDEDGATVNGAEFSLYSKDDVLEADDGTVTVKPGAAAYDSLTTANMTGIMNLDGGGSFPTEGHILEAGEYYLIETSAPTGYRINDSAVHIVVDNSGVYADAGTSEDGISVRRGVGAIVRSMLQFAADDDVDTTLNAIRAAMSTGVTFHNYDKDGSFTVSDGDWANGNILHLRYANGNKMLDYGLYDSSVEGTIDNLTFAAETGWSKLLIRQYDQHDDTADSSQKTNLGDMDITNLFSGSVTVRVSNDKTGNLKISKTVLGEGAPANQDFSFTVTVTDDGVPVSGIYETLDSAGNRGGIIFNNGKAAVSLKGGEEITVLALPAKAEYMAVENSVPDRYTPSVTVDGDEQAKTEQTKVSGRIQHNTSERQAVYLTYTNIFNGDVSLALTGSKILKGRRLSADDNFSFRLTASDPVTTEAVNNGTVVLPAETTVTVAGMGSADTEEFCFDEIIFKSEGTYIFNVTEILPSGVSEKSPVSGTVWYDTHAAEVTVTVTRDPATGILQPVVSYDNTGGISDSDSTGKAVFTNLWAGLNVSKTVSGNMGDRDKTFDFQLTLTDAQGRALTGACHYILGMETGALMLDQDGAAVFKLKHGQEITFFGLPEGCRYEILEPGAKDDGYKVKVTVGAETEDTDQIKGVLTDAVTVQAAFQNEKGYAPGTGLLMERWPWLLAAGFVLMAGTGLFFTSKRLRRKRRGKGGKKFERQQPDDRA